MFQTDPGFGAVYACSTLRGNASAFTYPYSIAVLAPLASGATARLASGVERQATKALSQRRILP
jgi:hypothetical protein